jgi:hypothetical protein
MATIRTVASVAFDLDRGVANREALNQPLSKLCLQLTVRQLVRRVTNDMGRQHSLAAGDGPDV